MNTFNYNNDYSEILTIFENKKKTFVNALCFTQTIKHASLELGVSKKCISDFMGVEGITGNHLKAMREDFIVSKKNVKLRFIPKLNGTKTSYHKNPEIKK